MKSQRHKDIVEIIEENDIVTQEELAEKLREKGYKVTQATISRDIRQLGLKKENDENGKPKYIVSKEESEINERFQKVIKNGIISIAQAQNIVVIKTIEGMAMGVAAAIDTMSDSGILGSIAGDDTIFCAAMSEKTAEKFIKRLRRAVR
ncbi:MAG: arginine repressor [Firmicutes bacterium]|nr:arginine repressor [Bacillota bacterium]